MAVVLRGRQLERGLVVRQRHTGREIHLDAVVDVLFFDQTTGGHCRMEQKVSRAWEGLGGGL